MKSIEQENYVQFVTVKVSPSLEVSGRLINVNDSKIAISVDGAYVEFNRDEIIDYKTFMAPDPNLMQQDIVKNTSTTASNTGFFVVMTVISIIAATILYLNP